MNHSHSADTQGLMERLLPAGRVRAMVAFAAAGFLVARCFAGCRTVHQRRAAARPEAMPQNLQRWEDEGGSPVHPVARDVTG